MAGFHRIDDVKDARSYRSRGPKDRTIEVTMTGSGVPHPPVPHLRVARPSRDLEATERFWVDGVGLDVLLRVQGGDHDLVMLGWTDASWHLELVLDPVVSRPPTPEDLLVLYLGGPVDLALLDRIIAAGGQRVAARNPYWDANGITVVDPDGYRLVLSTRSWA